MCGVLVVATLCEQRWSRRVTVLACVVLLLALGIQARRGFYFHQGVGLLGDLRMATGVSTFEREYANDPTVDVWKFLNTRTPPDAKILFGAFYTTFGASSYAGFWVNRMCYTTDSHLQGYFPLDDWTAFETKVRDTGVTHLVVSDEQFSAGRHGFSFLAGRNEYPFVRRLAAEHGRKIFQAEHMEVYELTQ
jgi:hypothetical protein